MDAILRADRTAVSPVVAEILLLAITVVLAAVVYLMAAGLLSGPAQTKKPIIGFSPLQPFVGGDYNATFTIAETSIAYSSAYYRFNLQVDTDSGTATALPASGVPASMTIRGTTYLIVWVDVGGDHTLNGGDTIRVSGQGMPLPGGTHFTFTLLWTDGSAVQQESWVTP